MAHRTRFKYKVGDIITFKMKFHSPSCGLVGLEGTSHKVVRVEDYGGACYALEGKEGLFRQSCFAGKADDLSWDKKTEAAWNLLKCRELNGDDPMYICSCCGHSAGYTIAGKSADTRYCPHCGKLMVNATCIEED